MSSEAIVVIAWCLGAAVAAISGWIIAGVVFAEDESESAELIMHSCTTAALAVIAAWIGYSRIGLDGGAVGLALGLFPGHWLIGKMAELAESLPSQPTPSTSDNGAKCFFAFVCGIAGAALTAVVGIRFGPLSAAAVAIVGSPLVACLIVGAVFLLMLICIAVFCVAFPRLGRLLDRQADRISSMLRKKRAE